MKEIKTFFPRSNNSVETPTENVFTYSKINMTAKHIIIKNAIKTNFFSNLTVSEVLFKVIC